MVVRLTGGPESSWVGVEAWVKGGRVGQLMARCRLTRPCTLACSMHQTGYGLWRSGTAA